MKKNLFCLFSVLFFFSSTTTVQAQCSLDQIGAANFVANSLLSDMAVAPNGTVYTFAYNSSLNKFQLYSATYPGAFTLLATISTSTTVRPSIAISKLGKISVLIRDENSGKVAKVYYLSGGTLIQQGTAISAGQATDLSLAFNSAGEEYVAYTDVANSNIATVKKWNSGSSAWINVGPGTVSAGAAAYNSLALDKFDSPLLAYQDATTAPANKISAKKYNGTSWVALGAGVVSTNPATNPVIKPAKNSINSYFLGYTEISTTSAIVQRYTGSAWSAVGSPVTGISAAAGTFGMDIDPIDLPIFTAIPTTPPYPIAYKFGGASWSALVSYIANSTANCTNVMLDGVGIPYYFYVDQPSNNALNVRKTSTPVSVAAQPTSTTVCNGVSSSFFTGSGGGTPSYQWQYASVIGFANVGAPYTGGASAVLSFVASAAINQDQVRCVLNAGCINIVTNAATLTVNTLSVANTSTNPTCSNTLDGAISTTVTGGSVPYTYAWSPIGGNAATATGLYGTTYSLAATDNIGCTTTQTIQLTTPPSINSSFSGNQNICLGSATTLTVNASGGVGAFTYSWTPSVNIAPTTGSVVTANPTSSITYGVQITDAIGCIATNTVGVNVNPLPSVSASASSSVICNGSSTNLSASGSANTYTWNPGNLSGTSQVVSPSSTTAYTVTGTNTSTGCTATATVNITVNPKPTANAGPTQTITCAVPTPTLAGSTGGGVTFSWTGSGIVSGATTLNPVVNAAGTYDLTVVSSAGCSSNLVNTSVVLNTVQPTVSASASSSVICDGTPTSLSATGSGSTYNWMPGSLAGASQVVSPSSSTIYTVTSTNSINGCTKTATVGITVNAVPVPTTNASGFICSGQSYTFSAIGATVYSWNPGAIAGSSISVSPASTTIYTVSGTTSGCTGTKTVQLTVNPVVTANAGATRVLTCVTNFTTLAGSSPSPGPGYSWTGPGIVSGGNTANPTINLPGVYSLTVTSAGCTSSPASVTITQNTLVPSPVTANTSGTLTCSLLTVGLSGTPGTGVTYLWTGPGITGPATLQNASANAPGTYTLRATSSTNGCTNTAVTNVTQNTTPPVPTATSSGMLTCNTLTVPLTGTPGTGVTYQWTGPGIVSGATTQNAVASAGGTYSLLVTGTANGCTATATTAVIQNTVVPTINVIPSQTTTCYAPTATLSTSSSADPSATYLWTSAVAGTLDNYNISNPQAYAAGIFTVEVTDTNSGCAATATVEVVNNISVPAVTVSFSPSNTLTCTDATVSAIATTSDPNVMFSWLGSGIVSGAATATANINQPGSYSVTTTNTINGCAVITTVTVVQDITLPVFSVNSTSSSICFGNSITMTATGANTYSWSTGQTTASITDSPATTLVYTVTGYGANGCSDIVTEAITVNALPALSVTGALNICKGSTANLTANGATSYTWSTGVNTASISETPTVTTTYTVTGDNGSCATSLFPTVSIISSKDISGIITSTTGATTGDVILYKYTPTLSRWDSVTIVPFTSSYSFTNVDSALYVVRAIPTATNIQVTYGDSAVSWQDAKIIIHGCTNNTSENIKLIPLANIGSGPGQLSGTITEGQGFGQHHRTTDLGYRPLVPGNPIGGIIVKGGKNPGGAMFIQTTTNGAGQYTLTGLPLSTGTNDFFIFVDIPGLDTNLTYHQTITSTNPVIGGLDFYVDSMYINPIVVTKVAEQNTLFENKVLLFPNPASNQFSIQYELITDASVQIELVDMIGNKVTTILPLVEQEKNKYNHTVNTDMLSSGVYFVKLKLNGRETTIKLILTK